MTKNKHAKNFALEMKNKKEEINAKIQIKVFGEENKNSNVCA